MLGLKIGVRVACKYIDRGVHMTRVRQVALLHVLLYHNAREFLVCNGGRGYSYLESHEYESLPTATRNAK